MRTAALLLLLSVIPLAAAGAQASGPAVGTAGASAGAASGAATTPSGTTEAGAAAPAAGTPAAVAAAPAGPDLSIPLDAAKTWNVGFTVFTSESLSAENAYLAYSLPLLLRDQVSGISLHSLGDDERASVRTALASNAVAVAETAITAARREHDALLFSVTAATDAARKAAADHLQFAEARRDFLLTIDAARIDVASDKPISVVVGKGQGKLLDEPLVPPAVYCARQGLDLLVGGTIREIQGYLLVDVWAYQAARDTMIISTREAALREDLYADLEGLGAELTGAVLGREWSIVAFAPTPPESSLYVDGKLVASGTSPALYLEPGDREIRITAPGYGEVTRTLPLSPGKPGRIDDTLPETSPGTIAFTTDPPGAALHIDSRWAGVTPLVIDTPPRRSRGVLELDGYYPVPLSLGPGSESEMTLTLPPDLGPRDVRQDKARDAFYTSFSWFAASIPIPLFAYGLVFDFGVQSADYQVNGQRAQAAAALSAYNGFLVGYYGGVAISAALFVWMITRIVEYVTVANGIAG
jgi:hypothetical protein